MESEARIILQQALLPASTNAGMASQIREVVARYGGVDLALPDRKKDPSDNRLIDFQDA